MSYAVETTDGRTVQIVSKEYRANEGVYLTAEDGEEFVVVGNGQKAQPLEGYEGPTSIRQTLPAGEMDVLVEFENDPDAAEAQV